MIRDVNEFPEQWKTNKNLHWWISRQNGERIIHPDEVHISEVECVEFAKQYHEEEIASLKAELEKANAEIATLKDRLAYEVDMIDGACNEQVQKLMGDIKLAMETIETLNKLKDNVQKERRQAWIELEKARELIKLMKDNMVYIEPEYDELSIKVNEFLKNEGE